MRMRPRHLMPLLLAAGCGLMPVAAQTGTASSASPPAQGKPRPATAAKPAPSRPEAPSSRVETRTKASQMAAGIIAAETALTPEELAIAEQVHQGDLPCELGQTVQIRADDKQPGYFDVRVQRKRYRMFPVLSRTGAIRLEDHKGEALWIQLANKSMFIDRKMGRRLADECMSPSQAEVASALKINPRPGLLDAPVPADTPKTND